MKNIAQFEKVSYKQFKEDISKYSFLSDKNIKELYDNIKLPKRATVGSAGYDFFNPMFDFYLAPGDSITIPTGIRCNIDQEWVLFIVPRSGLGFKYSVRLNNTVGIIDSDYFFSDNEGHIFIRITNGGNKSCEIKADTAFAQGIFLQYGTTVDDDTQGIRNGGFGSTSK